MDAFVDDIRRRSVEIPGDIESAEVETVEGEAHLPRFVTRQTDYLTLINRQLDQAIHHLSSIEATTGRLAGIGENTDRLPRIEGHTEKLVDGQERMIEILDERL